MKFKQINLFASALLASTILLSACGGGAKKESSTEEASEAAKEINESAEPVTYNVDTSGSTVKWKGEVRGVYGHYGVIDIKEGSLVLEGDQVTGGEVVIDMTTIQPRDSASYDEENTAQKLVNHLSTGDFFLIEEYPVATFKVKSHMGNKLIGDLTIRGNTNEETVELSSLEVTENGLKGEGKLVFDRQKYEVSWEHYVKDYILDDNIELTISLVANK